MPHLILMSVCMIVVNGHYQAPQGLRQGPRASSNFALIMNQELR
jgi:hypothetical protein